MTLSIETIRQTSIRTATTAKLAKSLVEARSANLQTAFLCHSHKDADLVQGVASILKDTGWRVYVDWADSAMPDTPNRETAALIKQKIVDLNYFLFLATPNSMSSRWCPWEIGFADGKKGVDKILIIPTKDKAGIFYGSEYLQLYRKLDEADGGGLAVWEPNQQINGIWVRNL